MFKDIRVDPVLPENLPTYKVFGRGDIGREIGNFVFKNSSNGLPAGYVFEPNSLNHLLSHRTLAQLSQKLREINTRLGIEL